MKTKAKYLLFGLVVCLLAVSGVVYLSRDNVTNAASNVTVVFHYQRSDSNYTNWNMWGWEYNKDGRQYNFSKSDSFGRCTSVSVPASTSKFGFIMRKGTDWSVKDGEGDRYVDLSKVSSGTVHVYILSGETQFTTVLGSSTSAALIQARVQNENTIKAIFTSNESLTTNKFTLKDTTTDQAVTIKSASMESGKSVGTIITSTTLSPAHSYQLVYNNTSYNMDVNYSSEFFENTYTYEGDDLGSTWTSSATTFKVWAPTATAVSVVIDGKGTYQMTGGTAATQGVWTAKVTGNLKNKYYQYQVKVDGKTNRAADPYAKAVNQQGTKAMVVDLSATNPNAWSTDGYVSLNSPTDAIVTEVSVRDFSSDTDSGIKNQKKYLAFTEKGTKTSKGVATGLDHLIDLGVTHVQLMPSFDFFAGTAYNWGYNPLNYNVPEGSYSTNPSNCNTTINEYKQMVQSLHKNNIGVIMDVVYNHTSGTDTCFNRIVPGYYYRENSSGSGCGNDIASERSMVSKYIVDSVTYWQKEYHIDGFRFDLVGLTDTNTINTIKNKIKAVNPDAVLYGEGWYLSTNVSKSDATLTVQGNASLTPDFGYFNDSLRDGIKGSSFDLSGKGYVTGNAKSNVATIKNGVLGKTWWSSDPTQMVNFISCHDNYTLWDKIRGASKTDSEANNIKRNNLAAAINFTSQGTSFFLSGEEFLRSKKMSANSYSSPDSINLMDYSRKSDYQQVYAYYKGLIEFRKAHAGLRMTTEEMVDQNITFSSGLDTGVIAYTIQGGANGEVADSIFIIYNPNTTSTKVTLPSSGTWKICVNGTKAGTNVIGHASKTVTVSPLSCYILVKGDTGYGQTDIYSARVTIPSTQKSVKYTGKYITPVPTVVYNGVTLKKGTDYTVTYKNNKNAGTATITINGKNTFNGSKSITFKIKGTSISKAKVTGMKTSVAYTGKAITQNSLVVKVGTKTLKKGRDYTISYSSNKKVGTAKLTIKGMGGYTGSLTKTFTIIPARTKNVKVSNLSGKKAKVTWSKVTGAKGYVIYMSTKKNGTYTQVGKVASGSKLTYTKTKLTKNKTYYYKVRAYASINGKIKYGSYSSAVSVKVKK